MSELRKQSEVPLRGGRCSSNVWSEEHQCYIRFSVDLNEYLISDNQNEENITDIIKGHSLAFSDKALAEHDKQIWNDAIAECIKKLAESEDTILSDRQYYVLEQLKE